MGEYSHDRIGYTCMPNPTRIVYPEQCKTTEVWEKILHFALHAVVSCAIIIAGCWKACNYCIMLYAIIACNNCM